MNNETAFPEGEDPSSWRLVHVDQKTLGCYVGHGCGGGEKMRVAVSGLGLSPGVPEWEAKFGSTVDDWLCERPCRRRFCSVELLAVLSFRFSMRGR